MTDAHAFRRWCWRVARLVASGTPFRRAIEMADVADELDRVFAKNEVRAVRSEGGSA